MVRGAPVSPAARKPLLVVADDDPAERGRVTDELARRYGGDYAVSGCTNDELITVLEEARPGGRGRRGRARGGRARRRAARARSRPPSDGAARAPDPVARLAGSTARRARPQEHGARLDRPLRAAPDDHSGRGLPQDDRRAAPGVGAAARGGAGRRHNRRGGPLGPRPRAARDDLRARDSPPAPGGGTSRRADSAPRRRQRPLGSEPRRADASTRLPHGARAPRGRPRRGRRRAGRALRGGLRILRGPAHDGARRRRRASG